MMNKHTRKLSKIPTEVREEIEPYFIDRLAITDEDSRKLQKVDDSRADYVRTGLTVCKWVLICDSLVVNIVFEFHVFFP